MKTIAVFASHGGSNLQAVIDAVSENRLAARIGVVISNNSTAEALERARRAGITACHISLKSSGSEEEMARKMLEALAASKADFILLLGYMRMLPLPVLTHYRNRIFNIHPALLPRYGGKGMYGIHVHEAVIAAGEKMSGVTIHRVDESYDRGEIVAQTQVPVLPDDTPEKLAARVLAREHTFLIETVQRILSGQIAIGV
ncbi:MAG: phosphoribosylglycinamide formyltransferase [Porphyromonadaceae bacterium]|nr:phosphoribosylglycinamide formyltransferase [Porphyromonadaceae bacterium]